MRYVVYFEPAEENLDGMDNNMSSRMRSQIKDFLDAWRPKDAFDKGLDSHLWQFKWSPDKGSGTRAYAGYYDGEHFDIALVLIAFKKKYESRFINQQYGLNERARELTEELEDKEFGEIQSWIHEQFEHDDRKLVSGENI